MIFFEYTLQTDGIVMCEPCVCVTLFSDADLGVPDSPEMLGPYQAFLELFRDDLKYCVLDGDQACESNHCGSFAESAQKNARFETT